LKWLQAQLEQLRLDTVFIRFPYLQYEVLQWMTSVSPVETHTLPHRSGFVDSEEKNSTSPEESSFTIDY
jgi:hypothetical protein